VIEKKLAQLDELLEQKIAGGTAVRFETPRGLLLDANNHLD